MRDTIELAREAQMPYFWQSGEIAHLEQLKLFEALARADERKIVMNEPLTKEMWQRFEDEIRADEREWPVQPKPWVGLTDEEVNHLLEHTDWLEWPHLFAKAIEAKLKEKNT
jgi:hypothetical protein